MWREITEKDGEASGGRHGTWNECGSEVGVAVGM